VRRGDLLVEIDPRDVQSAVDQAAADLESARVRAATSRGEEGRARRLMEAGLIPEQDYERTVEASAAAHATLVRAQTALRLAQERRQDVTIRAPIDGTILERTVEPGQIIASATSNVSGGTTLFRMADLSSMQVRAKVNEVDIGQIHPGQAARVTVEAYPGRTFVGDVVKIEPQAVVEQNVTMFPVLVRLENPDGLLRSGMNAEVEMDIARRADVVTVPNGAVVSMREAAAAAEVLGVDLAVLRGGRGGEGRAGVGEARGGDGPGGAARGNGTPGEPGSAATGAQRAEGAAGDCVELLQRARARGGFEALSEADRARLRECREAAGGGGRGAGGGGPGAWGGHRGGSEGAGGSFGAPGSGDTRPAVVFVAGASGAEPRRVLLGLSDWDHTEVLQGLEPGERVILVSVAHLQRQQAERAQRIQQRFGGPLGGSGGGAVRGR
jgi:HlyD family secretion protein